MTARHLAGVYPALGIGRGYDPDTPDEDYGGRLWEVLRDRTEKPKPKQHPDLLRQAAELVAGSPAGAAESVGPLRFSAERGAAYLARKGIPWPELVANWCDRSETGSAQDRRPGGTSCSPCAPAVYCSMVSQAFTSAKLGPRNSTCS